MQSKSTKQRIVLASTSEQENYILKRKIDPVILDLGPTQFVSVRPQGVASTLDSTVAMVIFNMPTFNTVCRLSVIEARRQGYRGPVLVIAKVEAPALFNEVKDMENVVVLEKPYEVKDLQGIVRKFISDRQVLQRVHRRFNTSQKAEVEVIGRRIKSASTVLNLSRGGAYLEMMQKVSLKPGDMVNMKIELSEMSRVYAMPARVVWSTASGPSGGPGVGIEFIGRGGVVSAPFGA